jgi:hypothetical protein
MQVTAATANAAVQAARNNVVTATTRMAAQNAAPLARSAVNAASRAVTPNPSLLRRVQLPKCQNSNVLLNSGGFPSNWQQLGAQQQAEHPINMVMFQLAYGKHTLHHCSCCCCVVLLGLKLASLLYMRLPCVKRWHHKHMHKQMHSLCKLICARCSSRSAAAAPCTSTVLLPLPVAQCFEMLDCSCVPRA